MPDLELLRLQDVTPDTPVDDVVHRPHQVSSVGDLDLFNSLGRRLVITQQDLINFHNPAYSSSGAEWDAHRRLTRTALALADRVVFFSHHVANDAKQERLQEDRATCVVPIGIDHQLMQLANEPRPPRGAESLNGVPFLVSLGADLEHKNNAFAIELFRALCDHHGWRGKLVLAGPTVPHGSSAAQEVEARLPYPHLDGSVIRLGSVGEAGKAWLLRHATAIMYPSVVEGFGLVPFEAAQAGIPCLFAAGTALAEMLPREAGSIVPWSVTESADSVIKLLCEQDAREAHVRAVREAGAHLTWQDTAEQLVVVYREAVRGPGPPSRGIAAHALERERELAAARAQTEAARAEAEAARAEAAALHSTVEDHQRRWSVLGEDALRLVGPDGTIPADLQRPLLAVSTRGYLRRPLFKALRAGYALSRRAGRHFGS
jgi:glycosyltransferase involved in cell wall biosynthesis